MNKIEDTLSRFDAMRIASGTASLVCPKCGGRSAPHARQGMPLSYKCSSCGESFSIVFACSDITQLKDAYANETDAVLANCHVKIVGKLTGESEAEQRRVDSWNRVVKIGATVTYLKSELEGKVIFKTAGPAYIFGDQAVVDLEHLGVALLSKTEPF